MGAGRPPRGECVRPQRRLGGGAGGGARPPGGGGGGGGAAPTDVLAEVGRFTVADGGRPVPLVNELQVVDGALLANVWMSPYIAVIDLTGGGGTSDGDGDSDGTSDGDGACVVVRV